MTRGRVVPYEGSPRLSARARPTAALLLILGLLGAPVGEARAQAPGIPAAVAPLITPPVTRVLQPAQPEIVPPAAAPSEAAPPPPAGPPVRVDQVRIEGGHRLR
jgi:hypothetical protein